ncbi:hypothetical protein PVA45_03735 [Entomospira entomophila]|uniref:Uncharacterized protein n=1 Tax=Entomospira entomophila TaxID=2719988 RepID=A0A968G8P8_9SPIO|nr:hypothetical protein [Entomospira entomophilus]NIZ40623.1 hypothetical protein [Entomospira entomophilus]WDI34838.1 hypothetical protein PVA45_03735 [Entomospira entomophilus]
MSEYTNINGAQQMMQVLQSINQDFFSKEKGLLRDFGLTIFPFFTFFDSLLDRIEIDIQAEYRKHFLARFWLSKPKSMQIDMILAGAYQSLQEQWDGVQRDAAERFVERFALFMGELDRIKSEFSSEQESKYHDLISNLRISIKDYFSFDGDNWQDHALSSLGEVLGAWATPALPEMEGLRNRIQSLKNRDYIHNLELLLQEERIMFHQKLQKNLMEAYTILYNQIEREWRTFYPTLES